MTTGFFLVVFGFSGVNISFDSLSTGFFLVVFGFSGVNISFDLSDINISDGSLVFSTGFFLVLFGVSTTTSLLFSKADSFCFRDADLPIVLPTVGARLGFSTLSLFDAFFLGFFSTKSEYFLLYSSNNS